MKRTIIIISAVLIISSTLGVLTMSVLFPNKRKYYKVYEENGEYYYRNHFDTIIGSINEKIPIVFENELALIREYKAVWGTLYINLCTGLI